MFTLTPEQIEGILRRLDFLRVETGDIGSFRAMTQTEYANERDRRRSLERLAENVANSIIDISKIVLEATDIPLPTTYRDVVLALATAGILDEALAQRLSELVRLRNIVAHEYLDIRWASLKRFIDQAPGVVREFEASVERIPSILTK